MTAETKMYMEKYPNNKKHEFYNNIYSMLHLNYDPETRIYNKRSEDCDFYYKNNKLSYTNEKELNIDMAKKVFSNLKESDIHPNKKPVQDKISYYLSNKIVPDYNSNNTDNYKKDNTIFSKDTTISQNYIVDKWYFQKRDERKAFYEKYFWDKEIDKMRKKNAIEKQAKQP